MKITRPGIFLDKDGCIVDDSCYPFKVPKTTLMKGAEEALIKLAKLPLPIIVVSNQGWVGTGRISLKEAEDVFTELTKKVAAFGGRIDGCYFCPHTAKEKCQCRKPEIGMLLQAAKDHNIDLMSSTLIGDMATDIQCGVNAHLARTVLLKNGEHGKDTNPTHVFADLIEAVDALF